MENSVDNFEKVAVVLTVLDKAPIGTPNALFQHQSGKDWMETSLLRALGKLKAAEYHVANIRRHIDELHKVAEEAARSLESTTQTTFGTAASATMLSRTEQNQIAYELDAFLAAGRACIDFVASMFALYVGMNRRTGVTKLLKMHGNPGFPFGVLLSKWQKWIEDIKEYRDECIHYRTIRMTGGYKVVSKGQKIVSAVIPVVVAETVQPDVPDTRRNRMGALADVVEISGISVEMSNCVRITGNDGNEEVTDLEINFMPTLGYVPVEKFSEQHLANLQQFVSESFDRLLALQFGAQYKMKTGA